MATEQKMSPRIFCKANPTAIPPTPRPAKSGVTSTPQALRTRIVTLVQRATKAKNRTTLKAVCAAVSVKFA